MKRLSRKESMAIATIHDALREFHLKGMFANVNMHEEEICISVYADTESEARSLKNTMSFFKDDDDTLHVQHYPSHGSIKDFFAVELKKMMV